MVFVIPLRSRTLCDLIDAPLSAPGCAFLRALCMTLRHRRREQWKPIRAQRSSISSRSVARASTRASFRVRRATRAHTRTAVRKYARCVDIGREMHVEHHA